MLQWPLCSIASRRMLAMPVALRYLIDNGFIAQDISTVNRYFGWFLAATVVFSLFASLRYYLVTWLGERVVADIRNGGLCTRHPHGPGLFRGHPHR